MKKYLVLLVLAVMLAGCEELIQKDADGNSPALDTVAGLRAANVASSPVNPYAPWIEIGLGLATVALGGSYVKKRKDFGVVDKKYQAHREVVAKKLRDLSANASADLYAEIGLARQKVGL